MKELSIEIKYKLTKGPNDQATINDRGATYGISLKQRIAQTGLRNPLLVPFMPTASTSQILDLMR